MIVNFFIENENKKYSDIEEFLKVKYEFELYQDFIDSYRSFEYYTAEYFKNKNIGEKNLNNNKENGILITIAIDYLLKGSEGDYETFKDFLEDFYPDEVQTKFWDIYNQKKVDLLHKTKLKE